MPSQPEDRPSPTTPRERRKQTRNEDPRWRTAITRIEPNKILIRGYPVDELMGRLSFAEATYLILRGELPSRSIGKLFGAVLVSSIDHGVTPPSTLAVRNVATTGAPLRACAAAGVLGFGTYHGGDIESCMRFIQQGLAHVRQGSTYRKPPSGSWRGSRRTPRGRRGSATASTPATRARPDCCRWRTSWNWTASTSG